MPYITFATYPAIPLRQYRGVVVDPVTSKYFADVDTVLGGETAATQTQYDAAVTAAAAAYIPPLPPVVVTPPLSDLAKVLTLLAASPVIDAATKAALAALKVP